MHHHRFFIRRSIFSVFFFFIGYGQLLFAQQVLALSGATPVSGNIMEVHFLDVAQGNCILIKLPNGKFMLYDAGSSSSSVDRSAIAAEVTKITGGTAITTIFLSHPDIDHINIIPYIKEAKKPMYVHFSGKIGEYESILENWLKALPATTKTIFYPQSFYDASPLTKVDGSSSVNIYMLAANVPGDPNTQSLVILLDYKSCNVLLTGDATAKTERWILSRWDNIFLQSTILSFGHHGSNHSSNKAFLNAVKPDIGVFSASATHRRYGHPRCVLIDYVEKMVDQNGKYSMNVAMHRVDCWNGVQYVTEENDLGVYLTATQGNILFRCDGNNYDVLVDKLK